MPRATENSMEHSQKMAALKKRVDFPQTVTGFGHPERPGTPRPSLEERTGKPLSLYCRDQEAERGEVIDLTSSDDENEPPTQVVIDMTWECNAWCECRCIDYTRCNVIHCHPDSCPCGCHRVVDLTKDEDYETDWSRITPRGLMTQTLQPRCDCPICRLDSQEYGSQYAGHCTHY